MIDNLTNLELNPLGFFEYYHPAVARGDYNWDAAFVPDHARDHFS